MPRASCLSNMRFVLLMALALPAFAQEQDIQRALIERDQRTQEFAARVRGASLIELQRLENLSARQLRDVQQYLPAELRPYERQQAAQQFVLHLPPPVVRAAQPDKLRPLPSRMPCAVDVVDVVPADGIEPPTNGLQNRCSTN